MKIYQAPPEDFSKISGHSEISGFRQISEISGNGVRIGRLSKGIRSPGGQNGPPDEFPETGAGPGPAAVISREIGHRYKIGPQFLEDSASLSLRVICL